MITFATELGLTVKISLWVLFQRLEALGANNNDTKQIKFILPIVMNLKFKGRSSATASL